MTTVAEMIAWLQTLPQDASVEAIDMDDGYKDVCLEGSSVLDYRAVEDCLKYPHMAGRVIVLLSTA